MKALITGITGFAGSHLAEFLLGENYEVGGTFRNRSPRENVSERIARDVTLIECEMKDATSVKGAVSYFKPDLVFHLAAQSFVPTSWTSPGDTFQNNVIGQLNLLEAIRELGLKNTRVQVAGSSEEYGMVYKDEVPIRETNPLRPLSPYAVSKIAQDFMGYQYHESYGMFVVRTRAFNHTGPRRGEIFMTSSFASQVARVEKKKTEPVIKVGNLEALRDFTDVRDTVRAYVMALTKGEGGEVYNIATGNALSAQQVLDTLVSMSGVKIRVEQDPARMRPSDVPILVGDSTKLRKATEWEPKIGIEKTLKDLLDYWRERV